MNRPRHLLAATIAWTALAATALALHPWIGGPSGIATKMAASTGFLAIALAAGAWNTKGGPVLLAALASCWWGDYFLALGGDRPFLAGLVAFLLGHIGFCGYFLMRGMHPRWTLAAAAGLVIPGAAVYATLAPHLGTLKTPVIAYIAVITLMLSLAIGSRGRGATRLIPIGAFLFYLSDLLVAREKFLQSSAWNPAIGLPLYYAAQICLAASPFHEHDAREDPRKRPVTAEGTP